RQDKYLPWTTRGFISHTEGEVYLLAPKTPRQVRPHGSDPRSISEWLAVSSSRRLSTSRAALPAAPPRRPIQCPGPILLWRGEPGRGEAGGGGGELSAGAGAGPGHRRGPQQPGGRTGRSGEAGGGGGQLSPGSAAPARLCRGPQQAEPGQRAGGSGEAGG